MFKSTSSRSTPISNNASQSNSSGNPNTSFISQNAQVNLNGFTYNYPANTGYTTSLGKWFKTAFSSCPKVVRVMMDTREESYDITTSTLQNQLVEYLKLQILPVHDGLRIEFDHKLNKFAEKKLLPKLDFFSASKSHDSLDLSPKVTEIKEENGTKHISYQDGTLLSINEGQKSHRIFASGITEKGLFVKFSAVENCWRIIEGKRTYPNGQVKYIQPAMAKIVVEEETKTERLAKIKEKIDHFIIYHVVFRNSWRIECLPEKRSYPTFEPYQVQVFGEIALRTFEDVCSHDAFMNYLESVNHLHTFVKLKISKKIIEEGGGYTTSDNWMNLLNKTLEERFDVCDRDDVLYICPKRIKIEEKEGLTTIEYKSGIIFEYSEFKNTIIGKRTYPNGNCEKGKFTDHSILEKFIEGKLIKGERTVYIFPNSYPIFQTSQKAILPLNNWKGEPSWQVFNVLQNNNGLIKCSKDSQTIESLLLENLNRLYVVFKSDAVSIDMRKAILPHLFASSEKYPIPPIFSYASGPLTYFISKALEWHIPIDLNIEKIEGLTRLPFMIYWIKQYTSDPVFYGKKENEEFLLNTLKQIDSKVFYKHAEAIFILFAAKKCSLATVLEYPFDTFTPVGKFIHKLVFDIEITTEDKEIVPLFKYDALNKIVEVAQIYMKAESISFVKISNMSIDHDSMEYLFKR